MPPTPTGTYALAKHYLREAIARSSTWQTLTGLSDIDDRRARVFRGDAQRSALPYPCCFVLEADESGAMHTPIGVGTFLATTRLAVDLWAVVGAGNEDDAESAAIDADNVAGQFLDLLRDANLSEVDGTGTRIVIRDVAKVYGPMFLPREETQGHAGEPYTIYRCGYTVQLGDSQ